MGKTWQTVLGILTTILIVGGVITYTDLFSALFQLKGIAHTHSGDSYCKENCPSIIEVNSTYWEVCFDYYNGTKYEDKIIFKKRTFSRTLHVNLDKVSNIISTYLVLDNGSLVPYDMRVDWMVPARGKGNFRELKGGDCWKRYSKKYYPRANKIKLVGHKEEWETVKWNFNLDKYMEIDPLWISGVEVGNKTVTEPCIPIHGNRTEEIHHYNICDSCYINVEANETDIGAILNKTNGKYYEVVKYCNYSCWNYTENVLHLNEQIRCDKIGAVNVSGKIYYYEGVCCELIENRYLDCISDREYGCSNKFMDDCGIDAFRTDLITNDTKNCYLYEKDLTEKVISLASI